MRDRCRRLSSERCHQTGPSSIEVMRALTGLDRGMATRSLSWRTTMNVKRIAAIVLLGASLGVWAAIGRGGDRDKAPAAPEFTGVTEWINSKPLKLADQKGKVVVVHFWTNGCINCIHNYPHYRAWQDKYKDNKNLVIV